MADKKDDKKKAPDAAPAEGEEGAPKKKSKLLLIIMVVVGVLVLVGGSVGATLFLTGFFDPKPAAAAGAAEIEAHSEAPLLVPSSTRVAARSQIQCVSSSSHSS